MPSIRQMSKEQQDAVWYTKDELSAMKRECRGIVAEMRQRSLQPTNPILTACTRGLERHAQGFRVRKLACQALLCEQSIQRSENMRDLDELAAIYATQSELSRKQALEWGCKDRQEVERYHIIDKLNEDYPSATTTSTSSSTTPKDKSMSKTPQHHEIIRRRRRLEELLQSECYISHNSSARSIHVRA